MAENLIIAIDGPSGVGKSTLGKALARRLGLLFIDSGAVYRAVALKALLTRTSLAASIHLPTADLRDKITNSAEDTAAAMAALARRARIKLEGDPDNLRVYLDEVEVTAKIRGPEVSRAASVVATIPAVRDAVIDKLRAMSLENGVVMDGRDIGTKVFPDARVKLFLEAAPEVRANRRWLEERDKGRDVLLDEVAAELEERDRRDRERVATPLVKADDAILIDTSTLALDDVITRVLEIIGTRS